jgi:hypothetical protein
LPEDALSALSPVTVTGILPEVEKPNAPEALLVSSVTAK